MPNPNSPKKDIIDVVDENDKVVESRHRNDVHRLGLLHREVHLWLFDKDYNIYFQKSPPHRTSAGLLDASIGGHVDTKEDYLSAIIRETKEESRLSVSPTDVLLLTKLRNSINHERKGIKNNFFRSIYIYKNPIDSGQLKPDPKETEGGFHKFSLDFLLNLNEENALLFHKFVPTHELPPVLNYLKNLRDL